MNRRKKGIFIFGAIAAFVLMVFVIWPSQIVASDNEEIQSAEPPVLVLEGEDAQATPTAGQTESPQQTETATGPQASENTQSGNGESESGQPTETPAEKIAAEAPVMAMLGAQTFGAQGFGVQSFAANTIPASINGIITNSADRSKICVIPNPNTPTNPSSYKSYAGTSDGLREAVFELYQSYTGTKYDYVIYVGASIDMLEDTDAISLENVPLNPTTADDASLLSLEGRVGTICFVGNADDPVTTSATPPAGSGTLVLPDIHAGSNIIFRNINFSSKIMFMYGYDMMIDYGAHFCRNTTLVVFGGGYGKDATSKDGITDIIIRQTGIMDHLNVYGGANKNNSGYGTFTGNTNIDVTSTVSGSVLVVGGGLGTTFNGDSSVTVKQSGNSSGMRIWGGNKSYGIFAGKTNVDVLIVNNRYRTVVSGGSEIQPLNGNTNVKVDVIDGGAVDVYGGGASAGHYGDTNIVLNQYGSSGRLSVFGGSEGAATIGSSTIAVNNIESSELLLYGGNKGGNFFGNSTINFKPADAKNAIVKLYGGNEDGNFYGISGRSEVGINLGGAGQLSSLTAFGGSKAGIFKGNVSYNVNTAINQGSGGAPYSGGEFYIYGGNCDEDPDGFSEGDITYDIISTGDNDIEFYGGGKAAKSHTGNVMYTIKKTGRGLTKYIGGGDAGINTGNVTFHFDKTTGYGNVKAYGGNKSADRHEGVVTYIYDSVGSQGTVDLYGGSGKAAAIGDVSIWVDNPGNVGTLNIYGGNHNGVARGNVEIYLETSGNADAINVYGGGYGGEMAFDPNNSEPGYEGVMVGNVNITLDEKAPLATGRTGSDIKLVGGGLHGSVGSRYKMVTVDINVDNIHWGDSLTVCGGVEKIGAIFGDVTTNINNAVAYSTSGGERTYKSLKVYGGGIGTSTAKPVSVKGNVTTNITNFTMGLDEYYGGTKYGDILGNVTNNFYGDEAIFLNAKTYFYGGSYAGSIGEKGKDDADNVAITNNINTSDFYQNSNKLLYHGANAVSGNIYGHINNDVTTGLYNTGTIMGYSGAGGVGTANPADAIKSKMSSNMSANIISFVVSGIEEACNFRVYGNITNKLNEGSFSDGSGSDESYTRGAGYGGFIQGNVTTDIGKTGYAYGHESSYFGGTLANKYSVTKNASDTRLGANSKWNIAAGGGVTGNDDSIFIQGDTKLNQYMLIANHTFGGSFGGVISGDSYNTLDKGIVHSLFGGGYKDYMVNGDSTAKLVDGEVDWLLSGGGMDTKNIVGKTKTWVEDGIVNAGIAGHYGENADSAVWGDTIVNVVGGCLSGVPGTEKKGIVGGALNAGGVLGNTAVYLDFEPSTSSSAAKGEGTVLPLGTYISGGRPFGGDFTAAQNNVIGRADTNTITLRITTPEGTDILNGANIYGDGGGGGEKSSVASDDDARANSISGTITMTVDAPDSTIGNLFCTSYMQAAATGLNKDVTINLLDAVSVEGISGSTNLDDFTNAKVAARSGGKAEIAIAGYVGTDPRKGETDKQIAIGNKGITNFTKLSVDYIKLAVSGSGAILNSPAAEVSTHKASYSAFGNAALGNGASLVFESTAPKPYMSVSELKFFGRVGLTSPGGADRFLLTSYAPELQGETEGLLSWTMTNKMSMVKSDGTWFGKRQTYQVLTFTDGGNNALLVTPYNIAGQNMDGSQVFVGDNDVTKTLRYGLVLPGIFLDAEVVSGQGLISHNIANVWDGENPDDTTIGAYGTVQAGEQVERFRLALPTGAEKPTVTFTPDVTSGSWLKGVKIVSTELDAEDNPITTLIAESPDASVKTWTSPDSKYSYTIEVEFTNTAELSARSIIVTETQAMALQTVVDVKKITEVSGRPFLGDNIDDELANIPVKLAEGTLYRVHHIDYRAGVMDGEVPSANFKTKRVYIVVVPDGTNVIIADDKHSAIYAQDTSFSLETAEGLEGQPSLDAYTNPFVILSDGTTSTPVLNASAISDIKAKTEPDTVNVTYTYTKQGETEPHLTKPVVVTLTDEYVCKIGTKGFGTLEKAVNFVNAQPAGEYVIEMLVDNHTHGVPISLSNRVVTLTTAATDAAKMPYKGNNAKACITFANDDASAKLVTLGGSAGFKAVNIILDGGSMAESPVMLIDNQGTGGVEISGAALINNFSVTGALINNTTSLKISGSTINNSATTGSDGLIHNTGTMEIADGVITGNTASAHGIIYNAATGSLAITGTKDVFTSITGNTLTGTGADVQGGAVYQAGEMSVSGWITIMDNTKAGKQNNVYLHETSTKSPYKNYLDVDVLDASSSIGVLTDTSTQNGGKGILYTVIGMPEGGSLDLTPMASVFTHDQLDVEPKAYQVIMDEREGGKNLVLGYNNAIEFSFIKVDATDHGTLLPGAEFNLYFCKDKHVGNPHAEIVTEELLTAGGCWQPVEHEGSMVVFASNSDGVVDLGALANGDYMLVEAKAPEGYSRPVGQWKLKINSAKAGYDRITITAVGDMLPPAFARSPLDDYSEQFLLPNMKPIAIANSGGWGIYPYIAGGVLLMLASVGYMLFGDRIRKRFRHVEE